MIRYPFLLFRIPTMSNPAKILTASAVACSMLLSSCATIFNRSNQPVKVSSQPAGLTFKVTDGDGNLVTSGVTPGEVRLHTSPGYFRAASYTFTFSKGTKTLGTRTLNAHLSGWYVGNILIGGLIGLIIVDPITGSMYTLPNDVDFGGASTAKIDHPTAGSLSVVSIDQLSPEQRVRLVRL
jgi:hypothetical protein